jgi:biotin-(acetyl-CoA carboxylase) ligase
LAGEVVARWSAVSATLGRRVAVLGLDGARLEGLAASVDALGRLIVETVDGPAAVVSEEVEHLR